MATAVAAPASISLEEYLHTSYHPDCDFVDDHLESASWVNANTDDYKR